MFGHQIQLFEHETGVSPARGDDFLKWIDEIYYESVTGSVESSTGWVDLIKIGPDLIALYVSALGDPWMSERRNFAPGWFLVQINDQGLAWGHEYGGFCDIHQNFCADSFEEMKVRHDMGVVERAYAEWDAEVNGS
jgi:hypothetical protein